MDFTSLSFIEVTRNYGRRRALNRVSFHCEAGEIVALLGANGAGKSTLLSIAATLIEPSSGSIVYGDHPRSAELRGRIGVLAHDLYLYPELTAAENLAFFASLHGVANVEARVSAALERAQLTERRDDPVMGFSRGMRQRLALERALLHEPRLVLLDEPFTGLDDQSASALVARLDGLKAKGCLIILATHDLEVVEPVVSRALLLREGRILPISTGGGSLRERYRRAGL